MDQIGTREVPIQWSTLDIIIIIIIIRLFRLFIDSPDPNLLSMAFLVLFRAGYSIY